MPPPALLYKAPARLCATTREGSRHAAKPPTARRAARSLARTRRGEICRRLLFREIRRYPCAGDGHARRPAAAMAQGPVARLDHSRIRHVTAGDYRAHAPRGIGRQAERTHRRGSGNGREGAVHRGATAQSPGARKKGRHQARRSAEDGGDVTRKITNRLVIATHNAGKMQELRELLAPYRVEAHSAGELGL